MSNSFPLDKIFTIVICTDKPGAEINKKRQETLKVHLDHVEKTIDDILVAGPVLADDGKTVCGSILVYKADRQEAQVMLEADPYFKANIWQDISYNVFYGAAGDAVDGLAYKAFIK